MEETQRPWGHYEVIQKVKIIYVKPHAKLSLQYHNQRDEEWIILSGSATVLIGDDVFNAKEGDRFNIPKKVTHRIETGDDACKFLEIASGLVDEDDIVRLQDDYGRDKEE